MDLNTLQGVGTAAGTVGATTVAVQVLKPYVDRLFKTRTRYLVPVVAWGMLFGADWLAGRPMTWDSAMINLANGLLVSVGAMGTHQVGRDLLQWR